LSRNLDKNGKPYQRFRTPPPCGTYAGYDYHRRQALEDPCDPCRQAMSLHWQIQRLKRGDIINALRNKNSHHIQQKRKAAMMNTEYEKFNDADMFERWGYLCHICEIEVDITIPQRDEKGNYNLQALHRDHVVAVTRGGGHTLENVRPAHAGCNIRKSSSEWTDELKEKLAKLAQG
jgi:5-methylcytosine-specific restriction endonuclease McrA